MSNALAQARALRKRGQTTQAVQSYLAAIQAQPKGVRLYGELAECLFSLGRFDDAELALRKAVELKPDDATQRGNLSMVLARAGKLTAAIDQAQEAVRLAPKEAALRLRLARLLLSAGQPDEAERHARDATRRATRQPEAWLALAAALLLGERATEAEDALGQALALDPTDPEALALGADILLSLGRMGEAEVRARAALTRQPESVNALATLAKLKTFVPNDPDWFAIETLLKKVDKLGPTDTVTLRFTAAKALEDQGDLDGAFEQLAQGNALRGRTLPDDLPPVAAHVAATETWDGPRLAAFASNGEGPKDPLPVFIVGMPRSGTTLLEQVLASHGAVHGAGETLLLEHCLAEAGLSTYASDPDLITAERLRTVGEGYLAGLRSLAPDAKRIVNKTPANWLHLGLIRLALPGARIIHSRRDPMDVGWSCFKNLFGRGHAWTTDLTRLGRYQRLQDRLTAHWATVLGSERMTVVDYETLVDNLEGEARRLVAFLGLDWDPACLRPADSKRVVHSLSKVQVRAPVHKRSIAKWRKVERHLDPLKQALE
ncbi:tetratricopeptide repeat-containing sulfotransferase family protein [Rhodospirillum sp. A1_3_36]|uniref:tetratricopeptide repeat-containing sulfotransferase family protein n=1 Tax=Rhodospirillum sp. A1_3_36 TaxID=3391666 RepID=UPI0039A693B5